MSTPTAPTEPLIQRRPWPFDKAVRLYWDSPLSNGGASILEYRLRWREVGTATDAQQILGPAATFYEVKPLDNAKTYQFSIVAVNSVGEGAVANFDTIKPGAQAAKWFTIETEANEAQGGRTAITKVYDGPAAAGTAITASNAYFNHLDRAAKDLDICAPVTYTPTRDFSPAQLPGLQFWLDATQITGRTNGQQLVTWTDLSPNQYVGTAFGTTTATYQTNAINGKAVVRFNGGQYINFGNILNINAAARGLTVLCAVKYNSGSTGILISKIGGNTWYLGRRSNTMEAQVNTGTEYNATSSNSSTTTQIVESIWNRTTLTLFQNGDQKSQIAAPLEFGPVTPSRSLFIGSWSKEDGIADSVLNLNGDIGEIIVYDRGLTVAERQRIEGYLAAKWGVTASLPATHPFKSAPPRNLVYACPLDVISATLQAWYDGADPLGTGVSPMTSNAIASWYDKSGRGRIARQIDAAKRALYSVADKSLVFNGTSTHYVLPTGSFLLNENYTIYAVEKLAQGSTASFVPFFGGSSTGLTMNLVFGYKTVQDSITRSFNVSDFTASNLTNYYTSATADAAAGGYKVVPTIDNQSHIIISPTLPSLGGTIYRSTVILKPAGHTFVTFRIANDNETSVVDMHVELTGNGKLYDLAPSYETPGAHNPRHIPARISAEVVKEGEWYKLTIQGYIINANSYRSYVYISKDSTFNGTYVGDGTSGIIFRSLTADTISYKIRTATNGGADMDGSAALTVGRAQPVRLWTLQRTAAGRSIYLNGSLFASKGGTSELKAWAEAAIGRSGIGQGTSFYNGNLYELVMYSGSMTPYDRERVERYLSYKWGVSKMPISWTPATFSPLFVTGLQAWYDGADPAGTGIPPANGTTLSNWVDKSGQGRTATAPTSNAAATYARADDGNYLNFNGSNFYNIPDNGSFLVGQRFTVFLVERFQATGPTMFLGGTTTGGNSNFNIGYRDDSNTQRLRFGYFGNDLDTTQGQVFNFAEASKQPTRIWTCAQNATGRSIYLNGSFFVSDSNTALLQSWSGASIGKYTTVRYMNGHMKEILMYTGLMDSTDRERVERYLAWKWGVNTASYERTSFLENVPLKTTAFTPALVPGIEAWYDAADPLGTGTPPANRAMIQTWADKSGQGRHATAPTVAAAGQFIVENKILSGSYIHFNGATTHYILPNNGSFLVGQRFTIFVVERRQTAGMCVLMGGTARGGNTNLSINYRNRPYNTLSFASFGQDEGNDLDAPPFPAYIVGGEPTRVWTFILDTVGKKIFMNGNQIAYNTDPDVLLSWTGAAIGKLYTNRFMNGHMKEMIMYTGIMDSADRERIERYLGAKWGVGIGNRIIAPFSPTSVKGVEAWYDGADPTGTGIPPANGTAITSWADKSGKGRAATAPSGEAATYQILYDGNYLNFTGSNYYNIPNNGSFLLSNTFTIFVAEKIQTTTESFYPFLGGQSAYNSIAPVANNLHFGYHTQKRIYVGTHKNVILQPSISIYTDTTLQPTNIWTLSVTGTQGAIYSNGNMLSNIANTQLIESWTGAAIGKYMSNTFYKGHMKEIIMYTGTMAAKDRQNIEDYLYKKWRVGLGNPVLDPVPAPTVIQQGLLVHLDATSYSGTGPWVNRGSLGPVANATTSNIIIKNGSGNGIVLDGATSWRLTNPGLLTAYTVSVWFKRTGLPTGEGACILTESGAGAKNFAIFTNLYDSIPPMSELATDRQFGGGFLGATGSWNTGPAITFDAHIWYNMTITWDGKVIRTYLNEALVGTPTLVSNQPQSAQADIVLGRAWTTDAFVRGELGQVLIYNRPLAPDEIAQNFNNTQNLYSNPALVSNPTPIIQLTGTNYSGSGPWINEGTLGSVANAIVSAGTTAKNTAGNGVIFNETNHYTISSLSLDSYTIHAWFKVTSSFDKDVFIIRGYGENVPMTTISNNKIFGGFWKSSGGAATGSPLMCNLNTWYHYILQVNLTNKTISIFLNGQAQSEFVSNNLNSMINASIRFGEFFKGEIGQVQIYNSALTAAQILQNYNATKDMYMDPTLLVQLSAANYSGSGAWNNEGVLGSVANATLGGGTNALNAAKNGLVLNGSTFWKFPNPGLLTAYTLQVWFKRTEIPTNSTAIISEETGGDAWQFTILTNHAPVAKMLGTVGLSTTNTQFQGGSLIGGSWLASGNAETFENNVWYHMTITWDGDTARTYMNGVEKSSNTPITKVDVRSGERQIFIGRGWTKDIKGEIGQVQIWNRALAATEVTANFTNSKAIYGL